MEKKSLLPTIRGGQGVTAVHMVALQGRNEMAWYLYPKTTEVFKELDWILLFFVCIKTGIYGKYIAWISSSHTERLM